MDGFYLQMIDSVNGVGLPNGRLTLNGDGLISHDDRATALIGEISQGMGSRNMAINGSEDI